MTSNEIELGLRRWMHPSWMHPPSDTRDIESEVLQEFEKFIGEIYRVDDGGKIPAKIISLKEAMSGCGGLHFSKIGVRQSLVIFNEG
jgi:hypothetical protein